MVLELDFVAVAVELVSEFGISIVQRKIDISDT
jgi:hypothetical protein